MGNTACCCAKDAGTKVTLVPADLRRDHQDLAPNGAGSSAECYKEPDFAKEPERRPSVLPPAPPPRSDPPEVAPRHGEKDVLLTLSRDAKEEIGLNLDTLDGHSAFVDAIVPGAIQGWNEAHPPDMQLKANDCIVGANGIRGDPARLLQELKNSTEWKLAVRRPVEVRVTVESHKAPALGLDLKYSPNGRSLLVSSIADGAIREWNFLHLDHPVTTNDRIIEINGVQGSARELLEAAVNVNRLDLTILHYG